MSDYDDLVRQLRKPPYTSFGIWMLQAAAAIEHLQAERDKLRGHILDIDAHATPYGDIPNEPGWVGTYLLTAGALHRALGTIGHTAPSCQAEADLAAANADAERLAAALDPCWTQKEYEALIAHRARVGEKPLRCDNCGKTMAEHGPLANCRARDGGDQ